MKKFLLLLALPLSIEAQTDPVPRLDAYLRSAVNVAEFNGNVLIAKGGKIIYQRSCGYKDFRSRLPLDSDSRFEIGLVTQQFTAAAVLLLVERHQLKLTDKITDLFPNLPYKTLTITHLLTNSSGLPEFYDEVMKDKWKQQRLATNADIIRYLSQQNVPLHFQPGQSSEETGTGFALLASVIEKVSGLSYASFMDRNIFIPLRLEHTKAWLGVHVHKVADPRLAVALPYDELARKYLPPDSLSPAFAGLFAGILPITDSIAGISNISSTTGDLLRWDQALKNHTLLGKEMQEEMFAQHILADKASKIFAAFGTKMGRNELGDFVMAQELGNFTLGYSTALIRYTGTDITLIVLCNKGKEGISQQICGALSYIVHDREVVPLYIHREMAIDSALLDRYVGKYLLPNPIELVKKEGRLYRRMEGNPDVELHPESPMKFFYDPEAGDMQLEFQTDAQGKVVKAWYIGMGLKKEITRVP